MGTTMCYRVDERIRKGADPPAASFLVLRRRRLMLKLSVDQKRVEKSSFVNSLLPLPLTG